MLNKKRYRFLWILAIGFLALPGTGCSSKAKVCPAYQEAERTGGTIDKNKKRRKKKVKQGIFEPKMRRKR